LADSLNEDLEGDLCLLSMGTGLSLTGDAETLAGVGDRETLTGEGLAGVGERGSTLPPRSVGTQGSAAPYKRLNACEVAPTQLDLARERAMGSG
jgi:hypothetical protein